MPNVISVLISSIEPEIALNDFEFSVPKSLVLIVSEDLDTLIPVTFGRYATSYDLSGPRVPLFISSMPSCQESSSGANELESVGHSLTSI